MTKNMKAVRKWAAFFVFQLFQSFELWKSLFVVCLNFDLCD